MNKSRFESGGSFFSLQKTPPQKNEIDEYAAWLMEQSSFFGRKYNNAVAIIQLLFVILSLLPLLVSPPVSQMVTTSVCIVLSAIALCATTYTGKPLFMIIIAPFWASVCCYMFDSNLWVSYLQTAGSCLASMFFGILINKKCEFMPMSLRKHFEYYALQNGMAPAVNYSPSKSLLNDRLAMDYYKEVTKKIGRPLTILEAHMLEFAANNAEKK